MRRNARAVRPRCATEVGRRRHRSRARCFFHAGKGSDLCGVHQRQETVGRKVERWSEAQP